MARAQMGRRRGHVAFPSKTVNTSIQWQPRLRTVLVEASKRSGYSIADIIHLCCLYGVKAIHVDEAAFRPFQQAKG